MPIETQLPGVFVEERLDGARSIDGVPTSNTAFVGRSARGSEQPTLLTSLATFEQQFGQPAEAYPLGDAVRDFFANGGTQAAADLVGVSRPDLVARNEAGDIPLHQQVGNQRRVLGSAVLDWHRQDQTRRRKALGQLGAHLDEEAFPC